MIDDLDSTQMHPWVSKANLFKLFIPEILKDIDKALYIDADTIIVKDLLRLYNTDISNKYLGAVANINRGEAEIRILGPIYYHSRYILYNSSVMLLNLKKMRKDEITKKLVDKKHSNPLDALMVEDVLRIVMPPRKIKLLAPWNNFKVEWEAERFIEKYFSKIKTFYFPFTYKIRTDEFYNNALIIHWNSEGKPWFMSELILGNLWFEYAHMINKDWQLEENPEYRNRK